MSHNTILQSPVTTTGEEEMAVPTSPPAPKQLDGKCNSFSAFEWFGREVSGF